MRRVLFVLVLGCGSSAPQRVEHPQCFPTEADLRREEYDAEGRVAVEHVSRVAYDSYRTWVAHHIPAECPVDSRELLQFTRESDVDRWGTLLRIECTVLSTHLVSVHVRSAGPDQTFDTGDDVQASRHHREGDSR